MREDLDERRQPDDLQADCVTDDAFVEKLAALDACIADEGLESDNVSTRIDSDDDVRSAAAALQLLERVRRSAQRRADSGSDHAPSATVSAVNLSVTSDLLAADSETALPTAIGRFQIKKRLGRGGYGIVFLAFDPKLKRPVAIKVPRLQTLLTTEMRQRFQREGELAGALDHPGIISVLECGNAGPLWYLVTAYCDGTALDDWLRNRREPVPDRTAAQLICGLADAIHHAHSRGVLHRDLKPGNILLEIADPESCSVDTIGNAGRITDFGLAKVISTQDSTADASIAGDIIGTPAYMSPEQASGRLNEVGVGSDIYGLGCLLYQLLTRQAPFETGSTAAVLEAVRSHAVVPPVKRRADIKADLNAICMKCLEKSPEHRYETAAHLRDDLRRFLDHEPVSARPISALERSRRWCSRNPTVSLLVGIVGLLFLFLVAGSTAAAILLSRAQKVTLDSLQAEIVAKDRATQNEEHALRALYEARLTLASARRNSGLPGQRFDSLQAISDAGQLTDRLNLGAADRLRRRNEAIAAMALVDLRPDITWPGLPPRTSEDLIGIGPDADRYARLEADGRVVLRAMDDNRELARVPGLGTLEFRPWTLFSPSGRILAVRGLNNASRITVQLWNPDKPGAPVYESDTNFRSGDPDFAFNSDSTAFAFSDTTHTITIVDLATMEETRRITIPGHPAWIQFSPDGTQLATSLATEQSRVIFLDIETGRQRGATCEHPGAVYDLAYSHNGMLMATACGNMSVYVWDAANRQRLSECRGHGNIVNVVSFAHHSDLLASTAWDMTTRLWEPLTGRQLLSTNGRGGEFSRDDHWLGMSFAGVNIGRWEVASSAEFFTLAGTSPWSFPLDMDFSPDGRFLAVAGQSEGATIWDMQTRRKVAHLPRECSSVRFSASRASLFVGGRRSGIVEWPFAADADGQQLQIGPDQNRFTTHYLKANMSLTDDAAKAVVNTNWHDAVLLDLKSDRVIHTLQSPDCRYHDVSSDGRWIAAGNWRGDGVRIWNADSGELVRELPLPGSVRVRFSPDAQWLLTCSHDSHSLWQAGTWEQLHHMDHEGFSYRSGVVSDDGRMAAVTLLHGVMLLDITTGQELARLTPPDQYTARTVAISPDGRRLALGTQQGVVCVWALDQLRDRLAELELDWQQPSFGPADVNPAPLQSAVHLTPHSASSEFNERYAARFAFDDNSRTRWNSARGNTRPAWIARRWATPQTIRSITIEQAFDRILGFRVQYLPAGLGKWTNAAVFEEESFHELRGRSESGPSEDDSPNPIFRVKLPEPLTTRGIRVMVTDATDIVSIREIRFDDTASR